jgi:hypothetical protein
MCIISFSIVSDMVPVIAAFCGYISRYRNQANNVRRDLPKDVIAILQHGFEYGFRSDCKISHNVPDTVNFFRIGGVTLAVSSAKKRILKQVANDGVGTAKIVHF